MNEEGTAAQRSRAGDLTAEERRNVATTRKVLDEFWGEGRLELADEIFTKDFIRHDPANLDVLGPGGYKRMVVKLRSAFPDMKMYIEEVFPHGNLIAFRATVSATHLGEFAGIKPTGAKCVMGTNTEVHFNEDGMVTEGWVQSDYLGLIRTIITAMSWWQFLLNLPAILSANDLGRSPDSAFGERGPYVWYKPWKKLTPTSADRGRGRAV